MSQLDPNTLSFFTEKGPDICAFLARQKFPHALEGSTAHFIYAAGHQVYNLAEYDIVASERTLKNIDILFDAREAGKYMSVAGRLFAEHTLHRYPTSSRDVEKELFNLSAAFSNASRFLFRSAAHLRQELDKMRSAAARGTKIINLTDRHVRYGQQPPLVTEGMEIERAFARAVSIKNLPDHKPDVFSTEIAKGTDYDTTYRQLTLASVMRQTLGRAIDATARRFTEIGPASAEPDSPRPPQKSGKIILLSNHRRHGQGDS